MIHGIFFLGGAGEGHLWKEHGGHAFFLLRVGSPVLEVLPVLCADLHVGQHHPLQGRPPNTSNGMISWEPFRLGAGGQSTQG